jgi:uncharacterized protein (TIGR00369 family)
MAGRMTGQDEAETAARGGEIWREPVRGSYADLSIVGLSGLDRMRAAVRRQLPAPPIHHLTGLAPVEVSPGAASFSMPASPWFQTPPGPFNAGIMAWLADAPLGTAITTSLAPGRLLTTSDLTMSFLRPATPESERLICRAQLVHAGRSLGLAACTVEDGRGRLLAHGTTRCFLFDFMNPPPEPPDPETLSWTPPSYDTPDPYLRPVVGEPVPQEVWDRLSGLDVMRGLMSGELPAPPIHHLTGFRWDEVQEGGGTLVAPATEWLASPARMVYGGALAFLADVALSGAVQTTVPAGTAYSPLDLKVNFVRPVAPDGRDLTARARVIHRGRTLCVSTVEITNADGKAVVLATGSTLILLGRSWTAGRPIVAEEEAARPGEDEEPAQGVRG